MKTTYIRPKIWVVRLQHQSIICTSTEGYDNQSVGMYSGSGNQMSSEESVWTKESGDIWNEEW